MLHFTGILLFYKAGATIRLSRLTSVLMNPPPTASPPGGVQEWSLTQYFLISFSQFSVPCTFYDSASKSKKLLFGTVSSLSMWFAYFLIFKKAEEKSNLQRLNLMLLNHTWSWRHQQLVNIQKLHKHFVGEHWSELASDVGAVQTKAIPCFKFIWPDDKTLCLVLTYTTIIQFNPFEDTWYFLSGTYWSLQTILLRRTRVVFIRASESWLV